MASFSITLTPVQTRQLSAKYGVSGTLPEVSGVTLSYTTSGDTVTFTVVKKPMLVPVSVIESHVKGLVEIACGQA